MSWFDDDEEDDGGDVDLTDSVCLGGVPAAAVSSNTARKGTLMDDDDGEDEDAAAAPPASGSKKTILLESDSDDGEDDEQPSIADGNPATKYVPHPTAIPTAKAALEDPDAPFHGYLRKRGAAALSRTLTRYFVLSPRVAVLRYFLGAVDPVPWLYTPIVAPDKPDEVEDGGGGTLLARMKRASQQAAEAVTTALPVELKRKVKTSLSRTDPLGELSLTDAAVTLTPADPNGRHPECITLSGAKLRRDYVLEALPGAAGAESPPLSAWVSRLASIGVTVRLPANAGLDD